MLYQLISHSTKSRGTARRPSQASQSLSPPQAPRPAHTLFSGARPSPAHLPTRQGGPAPLLPAPWLPQLPRFLTSNSIPGTGQTWRAPWSVTQQPPLPALSVGKEPEERQVLPLPLQGYHSSAPHSRHHCGARAQALAEESPLTTPSSLTGQLKQAEISANFSRLALIRQYC